MSDGFERDSNGLIYVGNIEQNAISLYNPANGMTGIFVKDPRINWVDTSEFYNLLCVWCWIWFGLMI